MRDETSATWRSRAWPRTRLLLTTAGAVLMVLGAFLPPLLASGDEQDNYGWWGYSDYGSLDSIPKLGMVVPLWSLFLLGAGLTLLLGFALSREPHRGLIWPLTLLSLLFVLQSAGLVQIGTGWRWSSRFLVSEWWVRSSWAAVGLLALVPIAEVLTERFYFRLREEGPPQASRAM